MEERGEAVDRKWNLGTDIGGMLKHRQSIPREITEQLARREKRYQGQVREGSAEARKRVIQVRQRDRGAYRTDERPEPTSSTPNCVKGWRPRRSGCPSAERWLFHQTAELERSPARLERGRTQPDCHARGSNLQPPRG